MISTECSNYTQYEGRKFHCSLLGQLNATENHLTKIVYFFYFYFTLLVYLAVDSQNPAGDHLFLRR